MKPTTKERIAGFRAAMAYLSNGSEAVKINAIVHVLPDGSEKVVGTTKKNGPALTADGWQLVSKVAATVMKDPIPWTSLKLYFSHVERGDPEGIKHGIIGIRRGTA